MGGLKRINAPPRARTTVQARGSRRPRSHGSHSRSRGSDSRWYRPVLPSFVRRSGPMVSDLDPLSDVAGDAPRVSGVVLGPSPDAGRANRRGCYAASFAPIQCAVL
jgi:hypothetical protein